MMKVLILGGTAFIGRDIARYFHEAGHSVTLFTRGNAKPTDLPPHRHIRGNRNERNDLARAAAQDDWDIVVDQLAFNADHVAMALEAFPKVRRYVLNSTVSVYRYIPSRYCQPLKEGDVDYDYRPPDENLDNVHWNYAHGKKEAEKKLVREAQVPWTIVRPPVVYGPNDVSARGFWYLGRLLKGGPLLLSDNGSNSFRLVYSRDCARAIVAAALSAKAVGQTYFVAQKEIITLRDFIEESARALKVKPELVDIPLEIAGDLAGAYATMVNFVPDYSAAERDLGFSPTPWPEFAQVTAKWFRDHWRGDEAKLYATRGEELELARRWKEAVGRFPRREPL